jgi:hypothetical protein
MAMMRSIPVLAAAALLLSPIPSHGQGQFSMKVYLGPMNELEVDARYHDPSDIDERLNGTSVIPIWLSVTNRSPQPVRLDYQDLSLDLGRGASDSPLWPIGADEARAALRRDGRYNALLSFLSSQGNDYAGNPFSRTLRNGRLRPGGRKDGYVFFMRPEGVPFTGFLALGTVAYKPAMLPTNTFQVKSPTPETLEWLREKWNEIFRGPPTFRNSYALLLGVSDYRYLEKLSLVNDDLIKMEKFLLSLGFHVVRVQNERLTLANVKSPQEFFATKLNPDDRLLVYFSGHGFHRPESGKERGYLALINAKEGVATPDTTIAMEEFVAWTRRVPAKHLLVLLDSCFSGYATGASEVKAFETRGPSEERGMPKADPATLYRLSAKSGKYLVMAGSRDQKAIADPKWNGGLFTNGVVRGLGGLADVQRDGLVTTRELYPWLREYVEQEALRFGRILTPLIKDLDPMVSEGEFVFTKGK